MAKKEKLRLTRDEEFQILKLVLDKVLWLGTVGLGVGLYLLLRPEQDKMLGLLVTLIGAFILMVFTAIISKEIHMHRNYK